MNAKPDPQPGQVWRKGDDWRRVDEISLAHQAVFYSALGHLPSYVLIDTWYAWSATAELVAGPGSGEEPTIESEAGK